MDSFVRIHKNVSLADAHSFTNVFFLLLLEHNSLFTLWKFSSMHPKVKIYLPFSVHSCLGRLQGSCRSLGNYPKDTMVVWMKSASHSTGHLSTWSPVGGTLWGGLGDVALLEVHHWEQALKLKVLSHFQFALSSHLRLRMWIASCSCCHVCCYALCHDELLPLLEP